MNLKQFGEFDLKLPFSTVEFVPQRLLVMGNSLVPESFLSQEIGVVIMHFGVLGQSFQSRAGKRKRDSG